MTDGAGNLQILATSGFTHLNGDQLEGIVAWCANQCEATGDARFCIVGDTLEGLMDWWTENKTGVPTRLLAAIELPIRTLLPEVLSAAPAEASAIAARLRREVGDHLLSTNDWNPWL